jgi:uncharacterized protein (TIGR00255 family)
MILSMTGYGKAEANLENKKVTIEIKSLNSKQIDMNFRMPSSLREKELISRQKVSSQLKRGKIDVSIFVEFTGIQKTVSLNKELIKSYYQELKEISSEMETKENLMGIVMRMPEVLKQEKESIDEKEWLNIDKLLDQAITNLNQFREDEGQVLQKDFEGRIHTIKTLLIEVEGVEKQRIDKIKSRLKEKIDALQIEVDPNRLEQEIIFYIEKLDINEEVVRLANHLDYFIENLKTDSSQGKKLGFICQEIGREVNTMGSKSNDAKMQQIVVQMKDELEKIKEQILNVL